MAAAVAGDEAAVIVLDAVVACGQDGVGDEDDVDAGASCERLAEAVGHRIGPDTGLAFYSLAVLADLVHFLEVEASQMVYHLVDRPMKMAV